MAVSVIADFTPQLAPGAVHIWTLPTHASAATLRILESSLPAGEIERANRFRYPHLRDSFVAVHGTLRHLLARYLDLPPARIQLATSPHGKPVLASGGFHFNLSHSGTLAAIAIGATYPLGIDLEQMRPLPDLEQLARRFFCPEEAAEVLAHPEPVRTQAFYSCWTRKEAYLKATGSGLSTPLHSFRVSVSPTGPARLLHISHDAGAAASWSIQDLSLADEYAAALACTHPATSSPHFPIADLDRLI
jgi:4'-phosphopantetheinyl transferase